MKNLELGTVSVTALSAKNRQNL